jgi:hypothetical protein
MTWCLLDYYTNTYLCLIQCAFMEQIAIDRSLLKYSTHVCAGFGPEAKFLIAVMAPSGNGIVVMRNGQGSGAAPLEFTWKEDSVKCSGRINDAKALCDVLDEKNATSCAGEWKPPLALVTENKQLYYDTANRSWKLLSTDSLQQSTYLKATALRMRKGMVRAAALVALLHVIMQPGGIDAAVLCLLYQMASW